MILSLEKFSCTFPAQRCKSLMLNGAGEWNRTPRIGVNQTEARVGFHPSPKGTFLRESLEAGVGIGPFSARFRT